MSNLTIVTQPSVNFFLYELLWKYKTPFEYYTTNVYYNEKNITYQYI